MQKSSIQPAQRQPALEKRTPQWVYMSPLALTLLPLIQQRFRNQPVLQARLVRAGRDVSTEIKQAFCQRMASPSTDLKHSPASFFPFI